jgi:hypothetical protein
MTPLVHQRRKDTGRMHFEVSFTGHFMAPICTRIFPENRESFKIIFFSSEEVYMKQGSKG